MLTVDLPGVAAEQVGVDGVRPHADAVGARPSTPRGSAASRIGAALDPESVTANHVDGRLTVTIAAAAKPAGPHDRDLDDGARRHRERRDAPEVAADDQPENGTSDNA